ncbi:MAG TPA: protein kinase [Terriglobia bacterium]|jgi:Tol biopolymer transport system component
MIPAGTKLGVYQLQEPLGAGGMGEVYRAYDQRLGRYVALKVLPDELAFDRSRRSRFEQEARHVAALNHPNIVALYDIGEQDGIAYMVTELIDGASLRGVKLPLRELLDVAAQIADGMAAAHAAGVTHRDLKPDNVMLTPDGRVKILDFGLAKIDGVFGMDAATSAGTEIGAVMGTVGYMAPEQVRGEDVDHRADIFAFGLLLYELLAGSRAFAGDTAAEVMAATLKQDPPELPPGIPPGLSRIVMRCLEKKKDRRFQSARDLAFALRHLTGSSASVPGIEVTAPVKPAGRLWIGLIGFAIGVLVVGALVQRVLSVDDAILDPIQLTRITADRLDEDNAVFAPDGRSVAYLRIGNPTTELLVKPFDAPAPIVLVRSNTALSRPVWFPDGNRICYTGVTRDFMCVGAAGGTPQRILENAFSPQFTPDGHAVYFIRGEGGPWLYRSEPPGSEPQRIGKSALPPDLVALSAISPDGARLVAIMRNERLLISLADGSRRNIPAEVGARTDSISWFPDSRHIAAAEETTRLIGSRLLIQDTESPARRVIIRTADPITAVTVSPDGQRLIYTSGVVERDIKEYSADGKFVRSVANSSFLEGFPSWAPAGDSFIYKIGGPGQIDSLWMSDSKNASVTLIQKLGSNISSLAKISPDGTRIAYVEQSAIRVVSTSGGRAITLLTDPDLNRRLCWSPDSKWIWYSSLRDLKKVPGEGGRPVVIPAAPGTLEDCSPDGKWLVRRGASGFVFTSTDGKRERAGGSYADYPSRAETSMQFGEGGRALYALRLDRRTIDVLDVETGQKKSAIVFDIPPEDQIEGFSFNATGKRVLLTTGGNRKDLWMAEGFAQPSSGWRRWLRHWDSPSRNDTQH